MESAAAGADDDHLLELERGVLRSRVAYEPPPEGANMASELIGGFRRHAERVLLVDAASGRQWTGAALLRDVGRLATGLVEAARLRPNEVVMTICEHSGDEILLALAVVLAGGSLYGSTTSDGLDEHRALCELVVPDVLVASQKVAREVAHLRATVAGMAATRVIFMNDAPAQSNGPASTNGTGGAGAKVALDENNNPVVEGLAPLEPLYFDQLCAHAYDEQLIDRVAASAIRTKDFVATYMLTSGSTGRPKVVPSTHWELVNGLYSMLSAAKFLVGSNRQPLGYQPRDDAAMQRNTVPLLPISEDEILAGDLPLDHGAGLNTMFLSLCVGSKFIVMPSYDEEAFWQAVSDYRITMSISSTTFGYRLFTKLKQCIDAQQTHRWDLSSFRYISCCGAKVAFYDLVAQVNKFYGHICAIQSYGCTELGFLAALRREDCRDHCASVGHIFPGLEYQIVEPESGRPVEAGRRGELVVWARSLFQAYRCHPDEDVARLQAGCRLGRFYRTGDQAHSDPAGRIHVHGRFKDTLVLMEDWKVMPAELEAIVDEHPLVEQSVVVGVPDPNLPGCTAPKAFCKLIALDSAEFARLLRSDRKLAELRRGQGPAAMAEHIRAFFNSKTARPKHLTGGVRIVEEFPRVGLLNKVDRKALQTMD